MKIRLLTFIRHVSFKSFLSGAPAVQSLAQGHSDKQQTMENDLI